MTITPIYASLIALLFLALSVRVIAARRAHGISLSDGDSTELRRRIRAHGNCAEYAPIALLLLALLELQTAPAVLLHLLGLTLLAGRILHGLALSRSQPWPFGRVAGMGLTLTMLGITAVCLLLGSLM